MHCGGLNKNAQILTINFMIKLLKNIFIIEYLKKIDSLFCQYYFGKNAFRFTFTRTTECNKNKHFLKSFVGVFP